MTILKQIRIANNESTRKLSEHTGIAHSVISLVENGKQKMSVEQARILSNHYKVSLEYILGEKSEVFKEMNQLLEEAFQLGSKHAQEIDSEVRDLHRAITELLDLVLHHDPSAEDIRVSSLLLKALIARKKDAPLHR